MSTTTAIRSLRLNGVRSLAVAACFVFAFLSELPLLAAGKQQLSGSLPIALLDLNLQPLSRLSGNSNLDLFISLPFRHQDALETELRELYDPSSANYHRFLTPPQFAERFGPSKEDYEQLLAFARSNHLDIVRQYPNHRAGLRVRGSVKDIERTFHLTMRLYQHPTENRLFYAPDVEPSVDLDLQVLQISGLDNFWIPKAPRLPPFRRRNPPQATGSGSGGTYNAADLRAAYIPGVTLTGAGQTVGLVTFEGYYLSDIRNYEDNAGLAHVPIQNVYLDGDLPAPGTNDNTEVSMDMEMVCSMAPGLSKLVMYNSGSVPEIYQELANPTQGEPLPMQISTSFELYYNTTPIYQSLQQMARQGQTFFCASGDRGAYTGGEGAFTPSDYPLVTSVGGTELTTTGPGGAWASESVWNLDPGTDGPIPLNWVSGGGPSPNYPPNTNFAIPSWQVGMDMSVNLGSTAARNTPDVAMAADNIMVIHNNGITNGSGGTSAASPLWAGFAALVNQQAVSLGHSPSVGFMNPLFYAVGRGGNYPACFHDVTTGNNSHDGTTNHYAACSGYDLCTGWGTPTGQNLIDALTGVVWVQYGLSDPGIGTYTQPYNSLARGTNAVASGGTIAFKYPGSTPEKPTISKPMRITATGGSATIGR